MSELDADLRRWQREERRSARRKRLAQWLRRWSRRLLLTRRWERFGLSGPLVIAILLIVAGVGSLASLLAPRGQPLPPPAPLGTPTAALGQVGGLLPDVSVRFGRRDIALADRRPSMTVLPPPDCDCDATLDALYVQAVSYGLHFDLLGTSDALDRLRAADRTTANGGAEILLDYTGRVVALYPPDRLTVVVTGTDGIIAAVLADPAPTTRMEPMLSRITGRAPSAA